MKLKLIKLIKDLIDFNKNRKNELNLKQYLVQELNYNEDDADEINSMYINIMKYN